MERGLIVVRLDFLPTLPFLAERPKSHVLGCEHQLHQRLLVRDRVQFVHEDHASTALIDDHPRELGVLDT